MASRCRRSSESCVVGRPMGSISRRMSHVAATEGLGGVVERTQGAGCGDVIVYPVLRCRPALLFELLAKDITESVNHLFVRSVVDIRRVDGLLDHPERWSWTAIIASGSTRRLCLRSTIKL